jgi:hypothetical protein
MAAENHGPEEKSELNLRISNPDGTMDVVFLEPWCVEITISVGDVVDIRGIGPADGALLEQEAIDRGMIVWGWPGSLLYVQLNGAPVETWASKTPSPECGNLTVREFFGVIGLG